MSDPEESTVWHNIQKHWKVKKKKYIKNKIAIAQNPHTLTEEVV